MKVSDLIKELELTVFCGEENLDTEIKGGYTSDLLSDVMGHMEEGTPVRSGGESTERRCDFYPAS